MKYNNMFEQADSAIMNSVMAFRSEWFTKALIFFTYLGNWQVIAGLAVIAIVILGFLRKKKEMIFLITILISGVIIRTLAKLLFHRQRPDASFSLILENGYAFPSGHAVMSVIFYGAIAYFIYKLCKRTWQKLILLFTFFIFIFLIGFSRIYLGAHWASDVVAGWLIGFSILVFFLLIFKKYFATLS